MLNEFRYRKLRGDEENKNSRAWAESLATIFSYRLKIPHPRLNFIKPDSDGELGFDAPTGGLYASPTNQIFILDGYRIRDLAMVVAHECRHFWQEITGRHMASLQSRERDAESFALELSVELSWDEAAIYEWIDVREAEIINEILKKKDTQ